MLKNVVHVSLIYPIIIIVYTIRKIIGGLAMLNNIRMLSNNLCIMNIVKNQYTDFIYISFALSIYKALQYWKI